MALVSSQSVVTTGTTPSAITPSASDTIAGLDRWPERLVHAGHHDRHGHSTSAVLDPGFTSISNPGTVTAVAAPATGVRMILIPRGAINSSGARDGDLLRRADRRHLRALHRLRGDQMTDKQKYWIRDVEGVFALVEGVEQRDWWTRSTAGPRPASRGRPTRCTCSTSTRTIPPAACRMPYRAGRHGRARLEHAGPPPGRPRGPRAPVAQIPAAAEPVKPTKTPAPAGGEQKEK
jgi:hypothetical protein